MAHPRKPGFVFRRNGRVHLNRRGGVSSVDYWHSRVVRISGSNAGYTMFRGSVKGTGYPLHSPVSPFTSPPVRHRLPSHFNRTLHDTKAYGRLKLWLHSFLTSALDGGKWSSFIFRPLYSRRKRFCSPVNMSIEGAFQRLWRREESHVFTGNRTTTAQSFNP